jgi:hypothetical protein
LEVNLLGSCWTMRFHQPDGAHRLLEVLFVICIRDRVERKAIPVFVDVRWPGSIKDEYVDGQTGHGQLRHQQIGPVLNVDPDILESARLFPPVVPGPLVPITCGEPPLSQFGTTVIFGPESQAGFQAVGILPAVQGPPRLNIGPNITV